MTHREEDIRLSVHELKTLMRDAFTSGKGSPGLIIALQLVEYALVDLHRIANAVNQMPRRVGE